MPRVFFVTGCSSGFGNSLIRQILKEGDIAVATARNPQVLQFSGTTEKNFLALKLDVTNPSDRKSAFEAAVNKFGRIDVLVNNAGSANAGRFEEYSEDQIRDLMEVNFFGQIFMTRIALAVMREQKPSGGVIQQVTSIGAHVPHPWQTAYNASKAGLDMLSASVALEF